MFNSPAIITPGTRQDAFNFGVANAHLDATAWGIALRESVDPRDMVAACIGRMEALKPVTTEV